MFLGVEDEGYLIDVGVPYKKIRAGLESIDFAIENIKGIFITHEHDDHIRGLRVFLRNHDIPVYTSFGTKSAINEKEVILDREEIVLKENEPITLHKLSVMPFTVSHDVREPLGFRFGMKEFTIGYATDLGEVSDEVKSQLALCDAVFIESNYDTEMLKRSSYPMVLKQRIGGGKGHLSNEKCADLIKELVGGKTNRFILGHLSEQNNLPSIALQTVQKMLNDANYQENKDYILRVASRNHPSKGIYF